MRNPIQLNGAGSRLLLLIEDDAPLRRSLQLLLQGQGFEVRAHASGAQAIADSSAIDARVLVADYRLPDSDGIEVLRSLRRFGWSGRAILITGFPSDKLKVDAGDAGFAAVLEKPLRRHQLIAALAGAWVD